MHLSGSPPPGRRRAAVLGRPIGHSLSPALHRAAYRALGLTDWSYDAIDCGAAELAPLVGASGPEWAGYSVTMPGKRAALDVADHVTTRAALVGAANTLLRAPDGSWTADNTDVEGIRAALAQLPVPPLTGSTGVTLLGAGGTAQAAVVALGELSLSRVDVLVRDRNRTAHLQATAERAGVELIVAQFDEPGAGTVLDRGGLVISTLPAGAADPLAVGAWPAGSALLDAIYHPWPTSLARAISAAGGVTVGGLEILLFQAAAQVTLMTGQPAPVEAMRAALTPTGPVESV